VVQDDAVANVDLGDLRRQALAEVRGMLAEVA
jgi:hypothetical protein